MSQLVNSVGEPDACNGHVRFDERGWETERFTRYRARADSTLTRRLFGAMLRRIELLPLPAG